MKIFIKALMAVLTIRILCDFIGISYDFKTATIIVASLVIGSIYQDSIRER